MTAWRRFSSVRGARASLAALALFALAGLGADLIASDLPLAARVDGHLYVLPCLTHPAALVDEDQQTLAARAAWTWPTPIPYGPAASRPGGREDVLAGPSWRHLAGTDDRGRDVAARLVHGARTALLVGGVAVTLFLSMGVAVGSAAAASPALDLVLGRVIEVGLTFPALFFLLALQGVLRARGASSLVEVALAIALTRWPDVARLTRIESRRVAASPHVEAARGLGATPLAIAWRHVLPLAAGPALVAAALGFGQAVLLETGLTFLGLGVAPPTASWGELLAEAHASGLPAHLVVAPTLAIALLVAAASRVAEGLRVILDPASERR